MAIQLRTAFFGLIFVSIAGLLTGCLGVPDATFDSWCEPEMPCSVSYLQSSALFHKGLVESFGPPSFTGATPQFYLISPSNLPAGLSFDSSTGVISGTASQLSSAATYTITAQNTVGYVSTVISLLVVDQPPSSLAYSSNPAIYTVGSSIAPNSPSSGGGTVVSYSVTPALPSGLSLNSSTGVITGTPTNPQVAKSYVLSATNTGGSTSTTLSIAVNGGLSYPNGILSFVAGSVVSPQTPTSTGGGSPTSCLASPQLPTGLSLSSTCVLSGTAPTLVQAASDYTITASTGASGSLSIEVVAGQVDGSHSSVTLPGSPGTAGSGSGSSVEVSLKDQYGNSVAGKSLSLSASGAAVVISPTTTSANASGIATFTITPGTQSGSVSLTAIDATDGVSFSSTGNWLINPASVSASASTLSLSQSSITADGASTSTVQVILRDSFSNLVPGKLVSLSAAGVPVGANVSISPSSGTSDVSGQVSFSLTSGTVTGSVTLVASDVTDSISLSQTAGLTLLPGPATQLSFLVQPANSAVFGNTVSTQVAALDSNSNVVTTDSVDTVTLSLYLDSNCSTSPLAGGALGNTKTLASGVADFSSQLLLTRTGTFYLKARSGVWSSDCSSNSVSMNSNSVSIATPVEQLISNASSSLSPSFTVNLAQSVNTQTVIEYEIAPASTALAEDYSGLSSGGYLTIPAGSTSASLNWVVSQLSGAIPTGARFLLISLNGTSNGIALDSFSSQLVEIFPQSLGLFSSLENGSGGGNNHSCAIQSSTGNLYCWGKNSSGQLGDGTYIDRSTPVWVDPGVQYHQVAVGSDHTCALTSASMLKCWGSNFYGQLGDGTNSTQASPIPIDPTNTYSSLGLGANHSCGILSDGSLKCWGFNNSGQVGIGVLGTNPWVPTVVQPGQSFSTVVAGANHTCGVGPQVGGAQSIFCWGDNSSGQLGLGAGAVGTVVLSPTTVSSTYFASGATLQQLAAGASHTCALFSAAGPTADLYCWGDNSAGELGNGSTTQVPSPIPISHPSAPTSYFESMALGLNSSCAIDNLSGLYCWGVLAAGGGSTQIPTHIDSATSYSSVSLGSSHGCGLTGGGTLKCWGDSSYGQLGDGTQAKTLSPVTQTASVSDLWSSSGGGESNHACAVSGADLSCWGLNSSLQLGDSSGLSRFVPEKMNLNTSFSQLSLGGAHTCGITSFGVLSCWGDNTYGQLGIGSLISSHLPQVVDPGVLYQQVAAGYQHTCGITQTGVLKCWGTNTSGQLGIGSYGASPQSNPTVIAAGTSFAQVAAGAQHTCAVDSTKQLWCWGDRSSDQLGDQSSSVQVQTTPEQVDLGVQYTQIAAGYMHSCGIILGGGLKCWGYNQSGQVGDGSTNNLNVPTAVDASNTYSKIALGNAHSCGVTSSGALRCWGSNANGELGDGTGVSQLSAVTIDLGNSYSQIAVTGKSTCGLTNSGQLKCWGANQYGQSAAGRVGQAGIFEFIW